MEVAPPGAAGALGVGAGATTGVGPEEDEALEFARPSLVGVASFEDVPFSLPAFADF